MDIEERDDEISPLEISCVVAETPPPPLAGDQVVREGLWPQAVEVGRAHRYGLAHVLNYGV